MQPYAVIGKGNTHQSLPPRPVTWTSKHHAEVQGQEISQPRARMLQSNSSSSISHNYGGEKGSPTNDNARQSHIIDMNRQSLLGFKVGEGNGNGIYRQSKGIVQTESHYFEDSSPSKQLQNQPLEHEPNEIFDNHKEYAIRLEGFEQKAPNQQRYSYTRRLINDIGHEETNDLSPANRKQKENMGQEIILNPEVQYAEVNIFKNLFRDLGVFEREKQYTNQIILTKKEQRVLRNPQPRVYACPKMDSSVSMMLASMKPAPRSLEDQVQKQMVPVDSRISMESASGHRRQPIFLNSRVEHFEESSNWPYENASENIYAKDNQIHFQEMEQSQTTPMAHSLRRELVPTNQLQVTPRKRNRIFEEHHNESKSLSFGQLEESEPPEYNSSTVNQKNQYTRNLIFQGGEQRNQPEREVVKHKRDLSSSSKFNNSSSLRVQGFN